MPELTTIRELPLLPLVEVSSNGMAVFETEPWRCIYANKALAGWVGVEPEQLTDRRLDDLFASSSLNELIELFEFVSNGQLATVDCPVQLQCANGTVLELDVRLSRLVIDDRTYMGLVATGASGDQRQEVTALTIRRDPLTGLADREFLLKRMSALLRGDRSADQQFAVLFIDLDNFKQVNDRFGHLAGDRVIREVVDRLSGCIRAGDHLVRFGGDEFVALIERVAGYSEIQPVIERIHFALAEPIDVAGEKFVLSASIGVAEASPDHNSPELLLQEADQAMYAWKRLHA